jgi:hypothetical protein
MFDGATVIERLDARIRAHAELLFSQLTTEDGAVRVGWGFRAGASIEAPSIESELSATRGLLESYLATGEVRFRDRALRVWQRVETVRWDARLGLYRAGASREDPRDLEWTPSRWAHYTAAAREVYKLVAARPGEERLAAQVLSRWARMSKLVLNGWDDVNGDEQVDWPGECVAVRDGVVRGGLQMAERALTGELGADGDRPTSDRDRDCVPEIDDAYLPAALASRVRFADPSRATIADAGATEAGR